MPNFKCHIRRGVTHNGSNSYISARCPHCRQLGIFDKGGVAHDDLELAAQVGGSTMQVAVGTRFCPNPKCRGHVFIVRDGPALMAAFPPVLIDFDSSDIPDRVKASFAEALECESHGCYIAAAMLVRKTLEELCHDRQANGKNLKEKVQDLRTKIILPTELFDGLDDIRLLGNDAAHIESHSYDDIGKNELEVAIEFTKEVLKATYQYAALVGRIKALKKPQTTP